MKTEEQITERFNLLLKKFKRLSEKRDAGLLDDDERHDLIEVIAGLRELRIILNYWGDTEIKQTD